MRDKRCARCGVVKDPGEFGPSARSRDGLRPWCAACYGEARSRFRRRQSARAPQGQPRPVVVVDAAGRL